MEALRKPVGAYLLALAAAVVVYFIINPSSSSPST